MNKKGFSILEVTVVVAIIGSLMTMLVPVGIQAIQQGQCQKTISEMQNIAQASVYYYNSNGSCPGSIAAMAGTYLTAAVTSSPFKSTYQLNCNSSLMSVSSVMPTGLVNTNQGTLLLISTSSGQDTVTVSVPVINQYMVRPLYAKSYPS